MTVTAQTDVGPGTELNFEVIKNVKINSRETTTKLITIYEDLRAFMFAAANEAETVLQELKQAHEHQNENRR